MAIPLYLIDYATPQLPKYWAWYLLTTIQYNINSQYSHGKVNTQLEKAYWNSMSVSEDLWFIT